MEHYPDALVHFEKAKSLAENPVVQTYQSVNLANALWKLGRYTESDALLQAEPPNDVLGATMAGNRAESLLSQEKYQQALSFIEVTISRYPKISARGEQEFELERAIAKAHLGMKEQALADLDEVRRRAKPENASEEAELNLGIAEISLNADLTQEAKDEASKAAAHYASTEQLDSELRSVCIAAAASKALNDSTEYSSFATKALDIRSQIQHTWSPQTSETYLSRPDIRTLLAKIAQENLSNRRSHGA
jgi:tetratricopeptide (TPR) repeat protein